MVKIIVSNLKDARLAVEGFEACEQGKHTWVVRSFLQPCPPKIKKEVCSANIVEKQECKYCGKEK